MIDAVFISDLHLHPQEPAILERFQQFLAWAKVSVKTIYILGDFFHAWAGDDSLDAWSSSIANDLFALKKSGINLFYMHGNRDFLLGNAFAKRAGWTVLADPCVIQLGKEKVLLSHGDLLCTKDWSHQYFRLVTRNKLFITLSNLLPLSYRKQLVYQVRQHSQMNNKSLEQMEVIVKTVIKYMNYHQVSQLIHGHIHKPGKIIIPNDAQELTRYVLSDWDDRPQLLCYYNTKGFYFAQIGVLESDDGRR